MNLWCVESVVIFSLLAKFKGRIESIFAKQNKCHSMISQKWDIFTFEQQKKSHSYDYLVVTWELDRLSSKKYPWLGDATVLLLKPVRTGYCVLLVYVVSTITAFLLFSNGLLDQIAYAIECTNTIPSLDGELDFLRIFFRFIYLLDPYFLWCFHFSLYPL